MELPSDGASDRVENGEEKERETGVSRLTDSSANNVESETELSYKKEETDASASSKEANVPFKKPNFLIGPKRGLAGKLGKARNSTSAHSVETVETTTDNFVKTVADSDNAGHERPRDPAFSYVEPHWGGKPQTKYMLEVLKSGMIVDTISLNERSFHVVGRLPTCDLCLAHPTISRYHAILQYRTVEDETNARGLYIYDLGSTHGTFWNGSRIRPNIYVRVRGGHMLKFGCSQRKYILQAPPEDQEEEAEYSVTELKQKRIYELQCRNAEEERRLEEEQRAMEEEEREGIDWGMGEDADEATDLQENPYASTIDEDLVLDDPKKTLRGWFEREGYDLQYQTEEKGIGQFLCWVELPVESAAGRSVRAEALVKGKKKEAVIQCAFEACKILDKYGVLRQANHESRKRKSRNWEEEDFYDSDEDNFLDRTGSVEKKREQRMRQAGKLEEKVETYESLLKKHEDVTKRISYLSDTLKKSQSTRNEKDEIAEEDALDAFMSTLSSSVLSKSDVAKMKLELQTLRKEEAGLVKLLNLTRPANLPALSPKAVIETARKNVAQVEYVGKIKKARNSASSSKKSYSILLSQEGNGAATSDKNFTEPKKDYDCEPEGESEDESGNDSESERQSWPSAEVEEGSSANGSQRHCEETKEDTSRANTEGIRRQRLESERLTCTSTAASINRIKREAKKPKNLGESKRGLCDQDVYADNYSTWVPPQDQAGDGKTSLNEKYGY